MILRKYAVVIFGMSILSFPNVWAATVLPGPVQPEQISQSLASRPDPAASVAAPAISAPQEEATPGGEQAKKIKFVLNGIIIEGNHVYSDEQLKFIYQKKLHQTISVAELFGIVQDITNFYRNNGYIITRAILPPQHVKGGIVRVRVIEGFLDKVDVSGNPKGARCLVKAFGNKIAQCPPLRVNRMERYLLLANQIPGTSVRAVLSPSKTTTGAADLTLVTENQFVTGYVSYDNYGTRYIGPQQMTANLGFNSIFTSGDFLQATVTKTPRAKELTFVDTNYNWAVDAEGTRWILGATRAETNPQFILTELEIEGTNNNYYTNLIFPYIRTRSQTLIFQLGFNYLDSHVTTLGQELYTDHIRSLGFSGMYNFADRWYGSNIIYLDLRQGLPILGYTSDTNPNTAQTSRPGGHANYTKIDGQISRSQSLFGNFSLFGLLKGQYGFVPLLAAEQFAYGGPQLGRGYDVAELIGDKGLAGSLEARYDWFINRFYIQTLEFYIFYDAGKIWNYDDIGGIPLAISATSTGAGMRFYFSKYISGNVMWTQPLTKLVASEDVIGQGKRPRVFFSVTASLY